MWGGTVFSFWDMSLHVYLESNMSVNYAVTLVQCRYTFLCFIWVELPVIYNRFLCITVSIVPLWLMCHFLNVLYELNMMHLYGLLSQWTILALWMPCFKRFSWSHKGVWFKNVRLQSRGSSGIFTWSSFHKVYIMLRVCNYGIIPLPL